MTDQIPDVHPPLEELFDIPTLLAVDTEARQVRGALRKEIRDIADIEHSVNNNGPTADLLDQLRHRLDRLVRDLDKVL